MQRRSGTHEFGAPQARLVLGHHTKAPHPLHEVSARVVLLRHPTTVSQPILARYLASGPRCYTHHDEIEIVAILKAAQEGHEPPRAPTAIRTPPTPPLLHPPAPALARTDGQRACDGLLAEHRRVLARAQPTLRDDLERNAAPRARGVRGEVHGAVPAAPEHAERAEVARVEGPAAVWTSGGRGALVGEDGRVRWGGRGGGPRGGGGGESGDAEVGGVEGGG